MSRANPFNWRWLGPKSWPLWLLVGVLSLLRWLPWPARRRIAQWLGDMAGRRVGRTAKVVSANIERCFPDWSEAQQQRLQRDYFRAVAYAAIDIGWCWFAGADALRQRVQIQGLEQVLRLRRAGTPVILQLCHGVMLEQAAIALTLELPMLGYVRSQRNGLLDWLMNRARQRTGARLLRREDGLTTLVREVRRGQVLYYFTDEDHGEKNSVPADFFASKKNTLISLQRLTRLTGAQVVPCHSWLDTQTGQYHLRFWPAYASFSGLSEACVAARINRQTEQMILSAPEQYLWKLEIFRSM